MFIGCVMFRTMQYLVVWLGISLLVSTTTDTYQMFQTYIPNGVNVPDPCESGTAWPGVGHEVPAGGGVRNPFGTDFAAQQLVSV